MTSEKTYDDAGRLYDATAYYGSTGVAYFEYNRTDGGRIEALYRKDIKRVMLYEYDACDRLTRETWKNSSGRGNVGGTTYFDFQFAYDEAGNRTQQYSSVDGAGTYYAYDADNSLTASWRNAAGYETYFAYDANGNCTRIGTGNGSTYFTYTAANMVQSITVQDAAVNPTVTYDYNGALERYKVTNNGATYFQYWHEGRMLSRIHGATPWAYVDQVYGPGAMPGVGELAWFYDTPQSGPTFPIMDHRGSATYLYTTYGTLLTRMDYSAFGLTLGKLGTWRDVHLQRYQSEWQYVGFDRPAAGPGGSTVPMYLPPKGGGIYDPETGRFLYRDPIGSRRDPAGLGGLNLYTYCNNNPVNRVDPLGLKPGQAAAIGGNLSWDIKPKPNDNSRARFDIMFTPNKGCCCAEIAFIQIIKKSVLQVMMNGTVMTETANWGTPAQQADYTKYSQDPTLAGNRVDVGPKDRLAIYMMDYKQDATQKLLPTATGQVVGSCQGQIPAKAWDEPSFPAARSGKGDAYEEFEICAFCRSTNEILGCIDWEVNIPDQANSTMQVVAGNYHPKPLPGFINAVDKWNGYANAQNQNLPTDQPQKYLPIQQPQTNAPTMGGSAAISPLTSAPIATPPTVGKAK